MENLKEQYITDQNGKRVAVVIPIEEFERLRKTLEEYERVDEFDCPDVTDAVTEGLRDVKAGQTVALKELLDALRD